MLGRTRLTLAATAAVLALTPAAALADADLAAGLAQSADTVPVGAPLDYTLSVTNNGPDPATNAQMHATYDTSRVQFSSFGDAQHVDFGSIVTSSGAITLQSNNLAAGSTASIVLHFTATAPGHATLPETVSADTADGVPGNNAASVEATLTWLTPAVPAFSEPVGLIGPSQSVVVTNEAASAITLGPKSLTIPDWLPTSDTCSNATLAVGATCAVVVRFAPEALGDRTGALSLPKTAGPGTPPSLTIALDGTGNTGPAGPPAKLAVAAASRTLRARAGRKLTLAYAATSAGSARLDVFKGRKRVGRVNRHARAGANKIAWRSRSHARALKAGRYSYRLTLSTGGQVALATGKIRLTR